MNNILTRHPRTQSDPRAMRAQDRPAEYFLRAATAAALAEARGAYGGRGATDFLARTYPDDIVSALLLRAATTPARLDTAQWAGALASKGVADLIDILGPVSAGAALLARGVRLPLERYGSVIVPTVVASGSPGGFTAEGAAAAVSDLQILGPLLEPKTMRVIAVLTRETLKSTAGEAIFRAALLERLSLVVDAAMFGAAAATEAAPAGLRFGATAVTAATGGGEAAMVKDLAALAAAVAPIGGLDIMFVASPAEAVKISLWRPQLAFPVLASAALPAGTALAVAARAIASSIDAEPEFRTSTEAVLHMDTSALDLSTAGTPPVVAAPARSMYQTDCVAIEVAFGLSWVLRTPASGAVAVTSAVTW